MSKTERMSAQEFRKKMGIPEEPSVIIGIDPDTKENGVCILTKNGKIVKMETQSTIGTMGTITATHRAAEGEEQISILVVIEAGWLNRSNWHIRPGDNARIAAAKGYDVGANHQVGKILAEYCEECGIPYKLQKPLPKRWQTSDGKISVKELQTIVGMYGNKLPRPCSQDMRDAVLLAWNEAKLPMMQRTPKYNAEKGKFKL